MAGLDFTQKIQSGHCAQQKPLSLEARGKDVFWAFKSCRHLRSHLDVWDHVLLSAQNVLFVGETDRMLVMSMTPVERATADMFTHYGRVIASFPDEDAWADEPRLSLANLAWMCAEGERLCGAVPIDKVSRWLGFIQGCLCMRGMVDVDVERAVSRPLFHAAYAQEGGVVPPSFERPAPDHT